MKITFHRERERDVRLCYGPLTVAETGCIVSEVTLDQESYLPFGLPP